MYVQLIIIFVVLAIFAVLHAITLVMLVKKSTSKNHSAERNPAQTNSVPRSPMREESVSNFSDIKKANTPDRNVSVVVCRKCLSKYDSRYNVCPKCGTLR